MNTLASPSITLSQFLLSLSKVPLTLQYNNTDLSVSVWRDKVCVARGVESIVQWISLHSHCHISRYICGNNKIERRAVYRGIQRVSEWSDGWMGSVKVSIQETLTGSQCPQLLFDKLLRHRNVKYMMEYFSTLQNIPKHTTPVYHISAVDVYLVLIICQWLKAYSVHEELLRESIPAVLNYVLSIRNELRTLQEIKDGDYNLCLENEWFDKPPLLPYVHQTINFSQRKKSSCSLDMNFSPLELSKIDTAVDSAISKIDWPEESNCCVEACEPSLHDSAVSGTTSDRVAYNSDEFWSLMDLPLGRADRKRQQIISIVNAASAVLPPHGRAVEFCAGGGYVGIALAVLRPDAVVELTDMNSISLALAQQRAVALQLTNVTMRRCELDYFEQTFGSDTMPPFDLGISLHACGPATDSVLRICDRFRASFVVSPCCYGFIQHAVQSNNENDSYPLSMAYREMGWCVRWMIGLCSRADRTFWGHDSRAETNNSSGKTAMRVIDIDRLLHAKEKGYNVTAKVMTPANCTPKNHILVGCI